MRLDHLLSKEEVEGSDDDARNYHSYVFHYSVINHWKSLAVIRQGDTPVPMPNTTVKTLSADSTSLETVRESRWQPEHGLIAQLVRAHA